MEGWVEGWTSQMDRWMDRVSVTLNVGFLKDNLHLVA